MIGSWLGFLFLLSGTPSPAFIWEQMGPGGGGQIVMMKGDPQNAERLYIGSDVAGLWRSENANDEIPVYDFLTDDLNLRFCQDIDYDPWGSNTLFIAALDGVYFSTDDGGSWSRFGIGLTNSYVSSLSVRRKNNGEFRIYAGIGYTRLNTEGAGCIYRYDNTTSSTSVWLKIQLPCASNAVVYNVVANPANSMQVWVATDDGIYYSTNSGAAWTSLADGLPHGRARALSVNPQNFQQAYLILSAADNLNAGLYFWNGTVWTNRTGDLPLSSAGGSVEWNSLAVDPSAPVWGQRIFVGANTDGYGCYMTTNGLNNSPSFYERNARVVYGWTPGNKIRTNPHSLSFAGTNLWIGKNGNFFRGSSMISHTEYQWTQKHSYDYGGGRWTNLGMVNTVLRMVSADPSNSNHLFMAVADRGIWRSTDGGESFSRVALQLDGIALQDAFFIKFDPADSSRIFASGSLGFSFTTVSGGIFKSTDGGVSWGLIGGGTNAVGGLPGAGNDFVDLDFSVNGNRIWLASKGETNGVYESQDGGNSWTFIGMSGRMVACIKAHPSNNNRFMIGTRVYSGSRGIWRADYNGTSWGFTHQLANVTANGFVYHPDSNATLIAATSQGLYRSINNGDAWSLERPAKSGGEGFGAAACYVAGKRLYAVCDGSAEDRPAMYSSTYTSQWDFGKNWTEVSGPPQLKAASMAVSQESGDLYIATKGLGLWAGRVE